MERIRRAWLTREGQTVELEDVEGGWYCSQLDLGWPEVREVTNNKPDQDGIDDLTRYFGSRAVTADVDTLHGAQRVDEIASRFAPFMHPGTRSQLHYVLDRDDNPERVLVVRPSGYAWPISGGKKRSISLSWVAADPIARASEAQQVSAWSGSDILGGRSYDLTYDRTYATELTNPAPGHVVSHGDVDTAPLLRVYGPITAPRVEWASYLEGAEVAHYSLAFDPGFIIGAGSYVEVDCRNHSVYWNGDRRFPCLDSLRLPRTGWPKVAVDPEDNRVELFGSSTDHVTQVMIVWRDGFLV